MCIERKQLLLYVGNDEEQNIDMKSRCTWNSKLFTSKIYQYLFACKIIPVDLKCKKKFKNLILQINEDIK